MPVRRAVRHAPLRQAVQPAAAANCSLTETRDESETSGAKQLKTSFTYDAYGNPNVISQDSVDGSAQNRSTDFDFDSFGQFPTAVTVGTVNLTTTFTFDYLVAQPATVTGPDGLTTSFLYDAFGRVTKETRPGGSYTTFTYNDCGSCFPQNAELFVRAQGSDGSDRSEFFDELGRRVGSSWALPTGTEGRVEIRYDGLGRVERRSRPYLSIDPVYWVTFQYDLLDRLTREDAPISEAAPSGAITQFEFLGHEVRVTDAENRTTAYVHNGARQIKQVTDALSGTTLYTYRPFGELATVTDPELHTTTIGYDARGFKVSLDDPNMGDWAYEYNVYGELWRQRAPITASPNWTAILTYDEAGRISTRCDVPEGSSATACDPTPPFDDTTTWDYYPDGTGAKGKPYTISGPGHSELYEYDAVFGAPSLIRRTLDGTPYDFDYTYDAEGRLAVLTYPESSPGFRMAAQYVYAMGHQAEVKNYYSGETFYDVWDIDALGREVYAHRKSGVDTWRDYDRATGRLKEIQSFIPGGANVQRLWALYDKLGNQRLRHNDLTGREESFQYDGLDRLQWSQVNGQAGVWHDYSAAGRVMYRDDVGSYVYNDAAHPYAVTSAAGCSYGYDANGRMTSRCGDALEWYSYDRPKVLRNGAQTATFGYGVDRGRYKQVLSGPASATIYYVGALFEKHVAAGTTTWRHYVPLRGENVIMVDRLPDATTTAYFLHRDHQGSVTEVTSESGALVQALAYDAWGLRRDPATWGPLADPFGGSEPTARGYTGHEHLDPVELVHMNGRVQDPRLGRFISADPFVQAPYFAQSLNRYSYVWNNPASLIDPSGFQNCDDPLLPCPNDTPDVEHSDRLDEHCLAANDPVCDAQYTLDPKIRDDILCASRPEWCAAAERAVTPGGGGTASPRDRFLRPPVFCDSVATCNIARRELESLNGSITAEELREQYASDVELTSSVLPIPPVFQGIKWGGKLVRAWWAARGAIRFPKNPGQTGHIFRNAPGHLADTPANRQLIVDVAKNPANRLGTDRFGNVWTAVTRPDGTQVWVSTRNGVIQNAGVNTMPRVFTDLAGP